MNKLYIKLCIKVKYSKLSTKIINCTVSMTAFSSFQKTQLGANQPLGIAIGMVPVLPALFVALIFPSYALVIIISIAVVTLLISLGLLLLSGRLIPREKLLP